MLPKKPNIAIPRSLKRWADSQALKRGFPSADAFVTNVLERERILAVRKKIDAILIEAINSGPATPMTAKDWARIRSTALQRVQRRRKKNSTRLRG